MIIITPQIDFIQAKSRDLIILQCDQCKEEFTKAKHEVNKTLKGSKYTACRFCSNDCKYANKRKITNKQCAQCKKDIIVKQSELKINNFCNRQCAVKFNSLNKERKTLKINNFCNLCNTPLDKKGKLYCSIKCLKQHRYEKYIYSWLQGMEDGMAGLGKLNNYIRMYMLNKNNYQCQQCGFNTPHPQTHLPPLEIDHIDGNWQNNKENNLRVLCPNCHALTTTFGSRNNGKGRHTACKKAGYSTR